MTSDYRDATPAGRCTHRRHIVCVALIDPRLRRSNKDSTFVFFSGSTSYKPDNRKSVTRTGLWVTIPAVQALQKQVSMERVRPDVCELERLLHVKVNPHTAEGDVLKTCYHRRRVLSTLAAISVAGPSVLPVTYANPLVWALRTLFSRALTGRQVQAITQQAKQVLTHERSHVSEPVAAFGLAMRNAAVRVGTHFLPSNECTCESCRCTALDTASLQYVQEADGVDSSSRLEPWDASREHTLYLKIPPGSQYVNDVLVLAITDLQTGRNTVIDEHRLAVLPSREPVVLSVPVGPMRATGPHRFDASIPALANQIVIQGTPPVVLR